MILLEHTVITFSVSVQAWAAWTPCSLFKYFVFTSCRHSSWLGADCSFYSSCVGGRSSRTGCIHVWWSHGECTGTEAHPVHSQALCSVPGQNGWEDWKTKQRWGHDRNTLGNSMFYCLTALGSFWCGFMTLINHCWNTFSGIFESNQNCFCSDNCSPWSSSVDPQKDWTPHRLELCLWAMTIAEQQKLPLLKDVKAGSVAENCSDADTDLRPAKKLKTR